MARGGTHPNRIKNPYADKQEALMKVHHHADQPVFISSTFTDMQSERDYLRDVVMPAISEKLAAYRMGLSIVDLRWGVETLGLDREEEKEFLILKVCLDEIERCRPFILVLLGDRYGWIPPAARMRAVAQEKGIEADIGHKSITALEIEFGAFAGDTAADRALFYFRDPLPYAEMDAATAAKYRDADETDQNGFNPREQLRLLKRKIERLAAARVRHYAVEWDGEAQRVKGLEAFGQMVSLDLWTLIANDLKAEEQAAPQTWQAQERMELDAFIREKTAGFTARDALLKQLQAAVLTAGKERITVVTADAGAGKSALMAKLCDGLSSADVTLLAATAGISARSSALEPILARWCEELGSDLGEAAGVDWNDSLAVIQNRFFSLLERAARQKRVVCVLDAINQLDRAPQAAQMTWLPQAWPDNSVLLLSAIPGTETEALQKRADVTQVALPALTVAEAAAVIRSQCVHKTLNPEIISILTAKKFSAHSAPSCGNPLWLSIAVQELLLLDEDDFRKLGTYTGTGEQKLFALLKDTVTEMPYSIGGIYGFLLDRAKRRFGDKLIAGLVGLIAMSRYGLREADLKQLLPKFTDQPWEDLQFAVFRRYFRAHIVQRGSSGQWDFAHSQLRKYVRSTFMPDEQKRWNEYIAYYLGHLPAGDPVRESEMMYHCICSDDRLNAAEFYARREDWTGRDSATRAIANRIVEDATVKPSLLRPLPLKQNAGIAWVCSLLNERYLDNDARMALADNINYGLLAALGDRVDVHTRITLIETLRSTIIQNDQLNKGTVTRLRTELILGGLRLSSGDADGARQALTAAYELADKLHTDDPANIDCTAYYVTACRKLTNYALLTDQALLARRYSRLASDTAASAYRSHPDSAVCLGLHCGADLDFAQVCLLQPDYKSAEAYYQQAYRLIKESDEAAVGKAWQQMMFMESGAGLASLRARQGRLSEAVRLGEFAMDSAMARYLQDPADAQYRFDLARQRIAYGSLLLQNQDLENSKTCILSGVVDCERFIKKVADSAVYLRALAEGYYWAARLYGALADGPVTALYQKQFETFFSRLTDTGMPANEPLQNMLADIRSHPELFQPPQPAAPADPPPLAAASSCAPLRGLPVYPQLEEAVTHYEADPADAQAARALAGLCQTLAKNRVLGGTPPDARPLLEAAIHILEPIDQPSRDPDAQKELVDLYLRAADMLYPYDPAFSIPLYQKCFDGKEQAIKQDMSGSHDMRPLCELLDLTAKQLLALPDERRSQAVVQAALAYYKRSAALKKEQASNPKVYTNSKACALFYVDLAVAMQNNDALRREADAFWLYGMHFMDKWCAGPSLCKADWQLAAIDYETAATFCSIPESQLQFQRKAFDIRKLLYTRHRDDAGAAKAFCRCCHALAQRETAPRAIAYLSEACRAWEALQLTYPDDPAYTQERIAAVKALAEGYRRGNKTVLVKNCENTLQLLEQPPVPDTPLAQALARYQQTPGDTAAIRAFCLECQKTGAAAKSTVEKERYDLAAYVLAQSLLKKGEADEALLLGHAEVCKFLAFQSKQMVDTEQAQIYYERAISALQSLPGASQEAQRVICLLHQDIARLSLDSKLPNNAYAAMEKAEEAAKALVPPQDILNPELYRQLSVLFQQRKVTRAADVCLRRAVELQEKRIRRDDGTLEGMPAHQCAQSYKQLAETSKDAGAVDESLRWYQKSIALHGELFEQFQNFRRVNYHQPDYLGAYYAVCLAAGRYAVEVLHLDMARSSYQRLYEARKHYAEHHDTNNGFAYSTAAAADMLGGVYLMQHAFEHAKPLVETAVTELERLLPTETISKKGNRLEYASAWLHMGMLKNNAGETRAAHDYSGKIYNVLMTIKTEKNLEIPVYLQTLIGYFILLGDNYFLQNNAGFADKCYENALNQYKACIIKAPDTPLYRQGYIDLCNRMMEEYGRRNLRKNYALYEAKMRELEALPKPKAPSGQRQLMHTAPSPQPSAAPPPTKAPTVQMSGHTSGLPTGRSAFRPTKGNELVRGMPDDPALLKYHRILLEADNAINVGEYDKAEPLVTTCINGFQAEYDARPGNFELARGLAQSHQRMGLVLHHRNRLDDAIACYDKAKELHRSVLDRGFKTQMFVKDLMADYYMLAHLHSAKKDQINTFVCVVLFNKLYEELRAKEPITDMEIHDMFRKLNHQG